jgi:sporulation protein YlmC with PRC-barrel domain
MDIKLNSKVVTMQGEDIGKVARIVFDPNTNDIDQLVVSTSSGERIVPLNMVQAATRDEIQLRVGKDVVDQLTGFRAGEYEDASTTCPTVPNIAEGRAYPPSTFLFQSPSVTQPTPPQTAESPKQRFSISEGTEVLALDGKIGKVDQVLTDQYEDKVLGFIVKRGEILSKDVRVPIEWVSGIKSGCIQLGVTLDQLEKHSMPPEGPYVPVTENQQPPA